MATVNTQLKKGQRPSIKTEFTKGSIPANNKDKVLVKCKQCKEDFGVQPHSKSTAIFCSPKCRAKSNNQKENHPCWKGGINYNVKYRQSVLEILGLKCAECAFSDIRALQVDHVNGNGFKERKTERKIGNPYKLMLQKVMAGSKDYQVLCANCNWIKKVENKEVANKR